MVPDCHMGKQSLMQHRDAVQAAKTKKEQARASAEIKELHSEVNEMTEQLAVVRKRLIALEASQS